MGGLGPTGRGRAPRAVGAATASLLALALVLGASCDGEAEAPARPQIVLVVDTDAPLAIQALTDPTIAADAVVDTLRVDVFSADGQEVFDYRDFVVADPADWPVSFGIPAPDDVGAEYGAPIQLRLRLFRSELGERETLLGQNVLEPLAPLTIERVVRIDFPEEGVARVGVSMPFECMGIASSFAGELTTCIDAARPAGGPGEGLVEEPSEVSSVGETPLAREVPCAGAPAGKVCVPGGFMSLGDPAVVNLGDVSEDAAPLHAVRVSPFALDPTEMTVAELRAIAPRLTQPLPREAAPGSQCTWTPAPAENETLPVNCIEGETAAEACTLAGQDLGVAGFLPSEAQWEFAARGRGKGWRFPWGDDFPGCCVTATDAEDCGQPLVPPPRSHPTSPECQGLGDVSPDGVYDLGGSMSEITRDAFSAYDEGCWRQPGILIDPVCPATDADRHATRGGDYFSTRRRAVAAMRRVDDDNLVTVGFRCAYQVAP